MRFDAEKDQRPCPSPVLLGNIEDYSRLSAEDKIYIECKPERLQAVKTEVADYIEQKRITRGRAASLRGKLLHISQTRPGRLGRATLAALNAHRDRPKRFCLYPEPHRRSCSTWGARGVLGDRTPR